MSETWKMKYELDTGFKNAIAIDDFKEKRRDNKMTPISKRLIEFRKKHNWTQSVMAEILGVSSNAIKDWEDGKMPRRSYRKKLAEFFGISLHELLGITMHQKSTTVVQKPPSPSLDIKIPYEPRKWTVKTMLTKTEYDEFHNKIKRTQKNSFDVIRDLVVNYEI